MKAPKVIKRYANRKLYDTERSCYVTLDEIAEMVKAGEEIQVIDNKSKDDLTAVTMAQIIVEEQKKEAPMPLKLLRSIIQSSNEAIGGFYQKRVADPAKSLRDDVERRTKDIFSKEEREAQEKAEQSGPVLEFVQATQATFETWQKRVDDQVRDALAKMTHLPQAGSSVDAIKKRIRELEARIAELEKDKKS